MKTMLKVLTLALAVRGVELHAQAGARTERVQFAQGAASTVIGGQLKGDQSVDYRVRAGAGQTLAVAMKTNHGQNYFNLNPPGSADVAMFIGSTSGNEFNGILPTDGDYTIRVYLMRAAARRNEGASFTLTIGVTGKALAAVPASVDALIPGTPYHASATIACERSSGPGAGPCQAFAIRRGFDGTATVEVRWPDGARRRILFIKGKPVASDSPDPLSSSRQEDATAVRLGAEERFDIPDALLSGG